MISTGLAARHGTGSFPVWAAVEVSRRKRTLHIRGKDRGEWSCEARPSPPVLPKPHGQAVRIGTAIDQSGNCSSLVSRPRNTATRLSTAKQVMIPVALESPPSCTTSNPATNGPKLVNTRLGYKSGKIIGEGDEGTCTHTADYKC